MSDDPNITLPLRVRLLLGIVLRALHGIPRRSRTPSVERLLVQLNKIITEYDRNETKRAA